MRFRFPHSVWPIRCFIKTARCARHSLGVATILCLLWTFAAAAQTGSTGDDPELLLQQAEAAHQHGQKEQAAREYSFLLSRHPEFVARVEESANQSADANAFLLAGQTRMGMSQFDLARRDADAARYIDPALPGLETLIGMILEQTSDYDGANAALQQALAANPNDFNAHLYLGAVFYFKRDTTKAEAHLTRALQLQPDSAQARYELALVDSAEGNLAQAIGNLQIVIRQIPAWLQPHVELSALYYRMHRPEDGAREKQIVDRMVAVQQQRLSEAAH